MHLHLDGAVRHSTLLELAQQKHMDLKGAKTVEDVKRLLVCHEPANLAKVLSAFDIFLPIIRGDTNAVERIAYELCEDQKNNGVVYFEARYSPHLLANHILGEFVPDVDKSAGEVGTMCDIKYIIRRIKLSISYLIHYVNRIMYDARYT